MITIKDQFNKKALKTLLIIMFSQMLLIGVSFVDTIMISKYDSGQIHFEAVGVGAEIWTNFQAIFVCLGIVFGVLFSQFKNNEKNYKSTIKIMFWATIIVCLISSLLLYFLAPEIVKIFYHKSSHDANETTYIEQLIVKYLRILALGNIFAFIAYMILLPLIMIGKTKYNLVMASVSILVNLLFDYLLIYVANLGATGAAWATDISWLIQLFIAAYFVYRNWDKYSNLGSLFKLDLSIVKMIFKRFLLFISSWIMYITYSISTMLIVAQYGSSLIKGLSVAYMISGIMWTILPAINQSVKIYIGEQLGESNFDQAKINAKKLFKLIAIIVTLISVIGSTLAFWVPNILVNQKEDIDHSKWAILIFAIANFAYAFQTFFSASIEAGGKQLMPNIFNYFAPVWLSIPLFIIFGPWVVNLRFEISFAIGHFAMFLTVFFLAWEYKRYSWLINLNKSVKSEAKIN